MIGGYDRNSISESSIEIPVTKGNIRSLVTTVQSIDATNTLQGTLSLTYDMPNFEMTIDSGVSQMWLPLSLCETLERTLGLMYDPLTQLYLVNDTARNALLDLAPEFTFTLAANSTTNETVSIVLPYAAFDLEVSEPFYNTSRNYFPIRRAVNESLYLLGRAFLQEAYLVVDWEKGNFSISQIRREKGLARDIVSILPPGMEATASSSLRPGAIAGIAVGSAVVVVALIAFAVCVMRRRKIGRKHAGDQVPSPSPQYPEDKKVAGALELEESALIPPEANSNPVHELPQDQLTHQLMSKTIYELPGDRVERELEANAETQRGEQCDTSDVVSERMKRPRK